MDSTLDVIQKFAKVGKILSKIALVFSIVGIVVTSFATAAAIFINVTPDMGEEAFNFIFEKGSFASIGEMYASLVCGLISTIGICIVSKYANQYFKNELKIGTPFTLDGAKEIFRLGIISLVVPFICFVICTALPEIMQIFMKGATDADLDFNFSPAIGICFIFLSFVFKFVAEKESMSHKKKNKEIEE